MKQPIKFTIENKDGVYIRTKDQEVNANIGLIRIRSVEKKIVRQLVNKFVVQKKEIFLNDLFYAIPLPFYIDDITPDYPYVIFIKNTSEIEVELVEGSKIEVKLFPEQPRTQFRHRKYPGIN